jgi:hypothetical protein
LLDFGFEFVSFGRHRYSLVKICENRIAENC